MRFVNLSLVTLTLSCTLFMCVLPAKAADEGAVQLLKIIANIRGYEDLYKNIDTDWTIQYKLNKNNFTEKSVPTIILDSVAQFNVVRQGSLFREEESKVYTQIDNKKGEISRLRIYDGAQTYREFGRDINIHEGRFDVVSAFRPHNMLIDFYIHNAYAHLSDIIGGGQQLIKHPGVKDLSPGNWRFTYAGEASINNEKCFKVRWDICSQSKENNVTDSIIVWLAVNKNYLPIHIECYDFTVNVNLPIMTGDASDWREVDSGIWLAYRLELSSNDYPQLRKGIVSPCQKHVLTINKAKLNPSHDQTYFKLPSPPNGSYVYQLNTTGKIVKKHKVGGDTPRSQSHSSFWLWLSVCICGLFGGWLIVRHLRS